MKRISCILILGALTMSACNEPNAVKSGMDYAVFESALDSVVGLVYQETSAVPPDAETVADSSSEILANQPGLAIMVQQQGVPLLKKGYGLMALSDGVAAHATPSMAVEALAEDAWDQAITEATNFRMASVSKQFTAMAAYILIDQGKLTFDTLLGDLFNDLSPAAQAVTVGQLMNHTSGLLDYEDLIPRDRVEQVSDADVLEMIRPLDSTYFEPGTQFRYSNTGFCLLTLVVEQVSGVEYREFMQREIFRPLEMEHAYMHRAGSDMPGRAFGYRPLKPETEGDPWKFRFADQSITSATRGDGSVYISANDYQTWTNALIGSSSFPSGQYLTDLAAQRMPVKDGVDYSLGWFVVPIVKGDVGADGIEEAVENAIGYHLSHSGETTGFRNIVYHNTATGLSISIFANRDDTRISAVFEGIMEILEAAHPVAELPDSPELFFWMSSVY
ncbi:MAG TPA: serine hydrolase domain-containing protein [Sphingobacteriaceae bacterium]|nr:serine hydrolase domain-containing protein [Sphingobacteriaceae bacterium]